MKFLGCFESAWDLREDLMMDDEETVVKALAPPQDLSKLSTYTKNELWYGDVVERHPSPVLARLNARIESYRFESFEGRQWSDYYRGWRWEGEASIEWFERSAKLNAMWDHAERISAESGFEYFDRYGTRHEPGKRLTAANEALYMFLSESEHIFYLS